MWVPKQLPCGSIVIVYVPLAVSDADTWPEGESGVDASLVEPFGAVIDTVVGQADPASILSTAAQPAFPVKVSFALWPGAVVAMLAVGPFQTIVPVATAGTV